MFGTPIICRYLPWALQHISACVHPEAPPFGRQTHQVCSVLSHRWRNASNGDVEEDGRDRKETATCQAIHGAICVQYTVHFLGWRYLLFIAILPKRFTWTFEPSWWGMFFAGPTIFASIIWFGCMQQKSASTGTFGSRMFGYFLYFFQETCSRAADGLSGSTTFVIFCHNFNFPHFSTIFQQDLYGHDLSGNVCGLLNKPQVHQVHTVHAAKNGTPKSLDKLKSKLAKMSTETTLSREQVPEKSRHALLILLDN